MIGQPGCQEAPGAFLASGSAVLLYRLAFSIAFPVLLARLVLRGRAGLGERLGNGASPWAGARPIWLHAASNGELASVRGLIEAMLQARPDLRLIVTTNTATGRALARGWHLPKVQVVLAPLDHRLVLRRFLARWTPCALIVVENELWPNRLDLMARRGLPVVVVGARMSARSARRWARLGSIRRRVIEAIFALSAQDAQSEAHFRQLGLPAARLLPRADLKIAPPTPAPAEVFPEFARDRTILAASTHEGEDEIILAAFRRARDQRPDLRLILAPRHPQRAPAIAALIAGAGLSLRTRSQGERPGDAAVYLADTMGEMANWYAVAGQCLVGGSLVPKGGHTPHEPAAFGCAILHGPASENFAAAYAALDKAGAALRVADAEELAQGFLTLASPEAQAALAQSARATLGRMHGSADHKALAAAVLDRLDPGRQACIRPRTE